MGESSVDLIRRFYAELNTGTSMDAVLEYLHPDFAWINPPYAVEAGTRRGHSGFQTAISSLDAGFEWYEHVPLEVTEHGDRALISVAFRVRSRGGASHEISEYHVITLRDGLIGSLQWFRTAGEARAAVGLDP